jgi:glycosyltransferase involved in cell wall biosynthesis
MKLSMVLPVYNEGEKLREFFEELVTVVRLLEFDLEAVFVSATRRR